LSATFSCFGQALCAAHHIRYIGKAGLFEGIRGYSGPVRSVGELITVRAGETISAPVLCLYLNLAAVRLESQRRVRGLSAHLYPADFATLPVPRIPRRIQEDLGELLSISTKARRSSSDLIDRAKRTIEEGIRDFSSAVRR
jgi:hypothetical protein